MDIWKGGYCAEDDKDNLGIDKYGRLVHQLSIVLCMHVASHDHICSTFQKETFHLAKSNLS